MNRLLEGDVGSGKTVVALIGALNAILSGFQVAYMAPTEILASQHYQTALGLFSGNNQQIALLTANRQSINGQDISKTELYNKIINGSVDLVIGTHALIGDQVSFNNLGLVIIDEQHRFGVKQRESLKKQNRADFSPHFLSLTATPIPRSLALILYGDLDLSIIRQMPAGRKKIITRVVEEKNRLKAYDFIRQQITAGRQVFVICPLIDPSDKMGFKSVTEEFKKLDKEIFPEISTGLLHGRLKTKEKEQVMADFKANKIKILVSTSVVEVGIDIPNASIMMIEGADRFGLAQLHQFRGRVGRGEHQSYCFLFYGAEAKASSRLSAMEKSSDGFVLAEYDLKFRGPGEVFGTRQSGMPEFKIATLNDLELIKLTKIVAKEFLAENQLKDYPLLSARLSAMEGITHLE
jgi:ATP-dependent DNA helicase RecG